MHRDILQGMKTSIYIDRARADEAAAALGTGTLRETVDAALREVVAASRRRELSRLVRAGELTTPTPAELERLRAPELSVGALDDLLDA